MDDLIARVKQALKITWSDQETDAEIEALVSDAIPTLAHKLGIKDIDTDFSNPGVERRLFLNYCRYVRNDCANEFDGAYKNEILQIRHKYEVKYYAESKKD